MCYCAEPTSVPLDLFIEDKNDTSVSIIWSQPAVVGDSGLDGYTIEVCKDGSKLTSSACFYYYVRIVRERSKSIKYTTH